VKVLVTGSRGQIGRALAASTPPTVELIATTRRELDLADADAVTRAVAEHGPDLIINAAAWTDVDGNESEPDLAFEINAAGAGRLAAAAAAEQARMIQISTDYVFDGSASSPYAPDAAPTPLGVYGKSKLAGEQEVLARLPGAAIVLRTAWVYAAAGTNFMLTMLRLMRETGAVRVIADQIGTPTAAASVADVIWALAALPDLRGIFHWTDAGVASWYDFAVAIAEEAASMNLLSNLPEVLPVRTDEYPTASRRPRYSVLDSRATIEATGLRPAHWRTRLRAVLGDVAHG
jgi:dTDP-4-dehydrorhamnose reductase